MQLVQILLITICVLLVSDASAAPSPRRGFSTPDEAKSSLVTAVDADDDTALKDIFGAEFISRISSGDPVADHLGGQQLALLAREGSELVVQDDGSQILEVGKERWPFPAPIVERDGKWYFDGLAGVDEILRRRVGENEIRAIRVCEFYVDAQRLYHSKDRTGSGPDYAQRFVSTPGKKDGLFWESTSQVDASPFTPVANKMISEGYAGANAGRSDPVYRGYHYRILKAQGAHAPTRAKNYIDKDGKMTGGFALLAYPTRWGNSGVMSFVVGPEGTVYERNLGPDTEKVARGIQQFDPDLSWTEVRD